MSFHIEWPYNEKSRDSLNFQSIKDNYGEINNNGYVNLCPLI